MLRSLTTISGEDMNNAASFIPAAHTTIYYHAQHNSPAHARMHKHALFPLHCSEVKPEQFSKQPSMQLVINSVNTTLFNLGNERIVKELQMWDIIDNIIELDECDVYSYNPELDDDPNGEEGSMYVSSAYSWVRRFAG